MRQYNVLVELFDYKFIVVIKARNKNAATALVSSMFYQTKKSGTYTIVDSPNL